MISIYCIIFFGIVSSIFALSDELDVLHLIDFEPYIIQRARWGELSQYSGFKTSDKLLKYKKVESSLGTIEVPIEDLTKLGDLSESEFLSILDRKVQHESEVDSRLGMELIREGDLEEGLTVLLSALKKTKAELGEGHILYASSLADVGYAYYRLHKYNQSFSFYDQAIECDSKLIEQYSPRNFAASINGYVIAGIKSRKIGIAEASKLLQDSFEKLVEKNDGERFKLLLNLANLYSESWMPIRAISILKLAKKRIPKSNPIRFDAFAYLGYAYMMLGEFNKANTLIAIATEFYETQPNADSSKLYMESLFQMGNIYLKEKKFDTATTIFEKVKLMYERIYGKIKGRSGALLFCALGEAFAGKGETIKSIIYFEAAETYSFEDPNGMSGIVDLRISHHLGNAYRDSGQTTKALSQYKNAYEMGKLVLGEDHEIVEASKKFITSMK